MKKRINSIDKLKIELEQIECQIEQAKNLNRNAHATRLIKIKEQKQKKLESWIFNS
jgi:hypothetical protein